MKSVLRMILPLFAVCALVSCDSSMMSGKMVSLGSPYEVVAVVSQDKWDGTVGETLRSVLQAPVEYLIDEEPMFNLRHVLPNALRHVDKYRNVVIVKTGSESTDTRMTFVKDKYAAPQVIVTIEAPDDASLALYLEEHAEELQSFLNIEERGRFVALMKKSGDRTLEKKISEKFGFNILIPNGFYLAKETTNFMWLRNEFPTSGQGIVIYRYPYTGGSNFEIDSLTKMRDHFVSLIPGENDGSYMITYKEYLEVAFRRINGRAWSVLRGFWDMHKDFMGGPFVSYSTVNAEKGEVIAVDCYIFAPNLYKTRRNLLRQMENVVFGVGFPDDKKAEE